LQPLLVTWWSTGDYILIAGERRLLAARQCGLEMVPALVREASDLERMELALIENVQRADLSLWRQRSLPLADEFGLAHDRIAEGGKAGPRSRIPYACSSSLPECSRHWRK
jgi:ParB family chromosome partitioning protein